MGVTVGGVADRPPADIRRIRDDIQQGRFPGTVVPVEYGNRLELDFFIRKEETTL